VSVVLDDALEDDSAALCLRSQIDVLGFRKITDHVEILETRREAGGKGDHVRVRFEARAVDEEGLVVAVRRHAAEAHCMLLSHDGALLLAFHANQPTSSARRQTATGREEQ
jgi:hypothetical protein